MSLIESCFRSFLGLSVNRQTTVCHQPKGFHVLACVFSDKKIDTNDSYTAALTVPGDKQSLRHGNFARWDLTDDPMWLNFGNPTINNLGNKTWDPEYSIVAEDYKETDWVYIIVSWNFTDAARRTPRIFVPAAHPV